VDAFPEQTFRGIVSQVRLSPEIVQNVVTYAVIIQASNPDLLLKPGMTANVTVLVDEREDVLKVPAGALRFRPVMQEETASPGEGHAASSGPPGSRPSRPNSGGAPGQSAQKADRTAVWILNQQGELEPVPVKTGISDGSSVEIVAGDLKEGDVVIIGTGNSNSPQGNQQVNPFAPQFRRRR